MEWFYWSNFYQEIALELHLDVEKDIAIAENYVEFLKNINPNGFSHILNEITSKTPVRAWIFGAGPSLEKDYKIFESNYNEHSDIVVVADGASVFLLEKKINPDMIFSDLDGSISALEYFGNKGTYLILHAHGDNYNIINSEFKSFLKTKYLPTIQTKPKLPFVYNFGGFTDGDRAISAILSWYKNIKVVLLGFTFGAIQGKYSKPLILKQDSIASEFKIKKLNFAKKYIKELAKLFPDQIINLSHTYERIEGVLIDISNLS